MSNGVCLNCNKVNNLEYFHNIQSNVSQGLGIFKVENEEFSEHTISVSLSAVEKKYMRFKLDSEVVYIPLI